MNNRIYILLLISSFVCLLLSAKNIDETQASERENPMIDLEKEDNALYEISTYPDYISLEDNHIILNGDDWEGLRKIFNESDSKIVNIVHIGDSHLQADMATAVARHRLCAKFGSAGRALIVPFKLAGTNEPRDYTIKFSGECAASRLLKLPWKIQPGFTGVSVRPSLSDCELEISATEPFDSVCIYYSGDPLSVCESLRHTDFERRTEIKLDECVSNLSMSLSSSGIVDFHGINLIKGTRGVAYHVIGNNGATYNSYNGLTNFSQEISQLNPSLIIISLGTNEAFGKFSETQFIESIGLLIKSLKESCPNSYFLLTTPSECQKRKYTRSGKRRRSAGFVINENVAKVRNSIMNFAASEKIPVYDFYKISGGAGASTKWLSDGKMNKDRVHLLQPGYVLYGNLFSNAMLEALTLPLSSNLTLND